MTGMSADRVHPGNKKDNFWEMGDTGPCGPCSEIHIDLSPDKSCGHLVKRRRSPRDGVLEPGVHPVQPRGGRQADAAAGQARRYGMGFERIAGILQGHCNNYATDVFWPIIQAVEHLSKHRYGTAVPRPQGANRYAVFDAANMGDVACRVIADHIRTLVFAISDGCPPDKDGRGFVLRRILRRGVRYGWQYLGRREPFLCKIVPTVVDVLGGAFPKLKENPGRVAEILRGEEESFARTLDRGIALFQEAADRAANEHNGEIQGDDAFKLHDTYGFPIDLTQIMSNERKLRVNIGEYERLMEEARVRARTGSQVIEDDLLDSINFDQLSDNVRLRLADTDDSSKYAVPPECEAVVHYIAQMGTNRGRRSRRSR
jgi:alanyl-tRNA synthetase